MEKIELQLIRNATLRISYAGKKILVDPMLAAQNEIMSFVDSSKKLNPTINLPIPFEEVIKDISLTLLTHTHSDHFDFKAKEVLPKKSPVYIQPSDKNVLDEAGFNNVFIIEKKETIENITITRTHGKHGPDEILEDLGEVSGYILQAEGYPTIYIVGDCIWDSGIEQTIKKHKPDIIITNSGGAIYIGDNRILMDVEETLKVAKTAPNATIIAVHLEALDHCQVTREMIKSAAAKERIVILTPADGETIVY